MRIGIRFQDLPTTNRPFLYETIHHPNIKFPDLHYFDRYRLAVLRALPNLEKLDDKVVLPEEVQTAMAIGRPLIHPLEMDASPQSDAVTPEVRTNFFLFLFFSSLETIYNNNKKKLVNGRMLNYILTYAFNIYVILSSISNIFCMLYILQLIDVYLTVIKIYLYQ